MEGGREGGSICIWIWGPILRLTGGNARWCSCVWYALGTALLWIVAPRLLSLPHHLALVNSQDPPPPLY